MISAKRILAASMAPARWVAAGLAAPILVALLFEPRTTVHLGIAMPGSLMAYVAGLAVALVVWAATAAATRRRNDDLLEREAYLAVALGWLVACVLCAVPFAVMGLGPGNSLFEAMSGLTGTGMSAVRVPADRLPPSLLFWRAQLQWMGGLAFIVLTTAVVSRLTHGGLQLLRGEFTGPATRRIRAKTRETIRGLSRLYVALTLAFAAVLFLVYRFRLGLPSASAAIEAVAETFAAYGNGAFTLHRDGLGHSDPIVQLLLALMMVAGATNVTLAFLLVRRGQVRTLTSNPEWRFFLTLLVASAATVALILVRADATSLSLLRDATFQMVSLATGTGLAVVDYRLWPPAALLLVLLVVLVGGTAGSAAGGIKAFRALVLAKLVGREVRRLVHPSAVIPVRVGRRVVAEDTVTAVIAFFFSYLTLWLVGTFALALLEPHLDVNESASVALAAIGNVSAGFGSVGPGFGTSHLEWGKVVLGVLMWFGRMELFAAILVFTPRSWRS